jgi:hypothetical protein
MPSSSPGIHVVRGLDPVAVGALHDEQHRGSCTSLAQGDQLFEVASTACRDGIGKAGRGSMRQRDALDLDVRGPRITSMSGEPEIEPRSLPDPDLGPDGRVAAELGDRARRERPRDQVIGSGGVQTDEDPSDADHLEGMGELPPRIATRRAADEGARPIGPGHRTGIRAMDRTDRAVPELDVRQEPLVATHQTTREVCPDPERYGFDGSSLTST